MYVRMSEPPLPLPLSEDVDPPLSRMLDPYPSGEFGLRI